MTTFPQWNLWPKCPEKLIQDVLWYHWLNGWGIRRQYVYVQLTVVLICCRGRRRNAVVLHQWGECSSRCHMEGRCFSPSSTSGTLSACCRGPGAYYRKACSRHCPGRTSSQLPSLMAFERCSCARGNGACLHPTRWRRWERFLASGYSGSALRDDLSRVWLFYVQNSRRNASLHHARWHWGDSGCFYCREIAVHR